MLAAPRPLHTDPRLGSCAERTCNMLTIVHGQELGSCCSPCTSPIGVGACSVLHGAALCCAAASSVRMSCGKPFCPLGTGACMARACSALAIAEGFVAPVLACDT